MGTSADRNIAAEKEFASLVRVLVQTADDAKQCLELLKRNLSDYDKSHGRHFFNTSKSFMRSDIRNAKDMSSELKYVAHQIHKSHTHSKAEVSSARDMMNSTAEAMEVLKRTARRYDEKNERKTRVKGKSMREDKESKGGLFRKSDTVDNQEEDILSSPDTVEELVESTLRGNFDLNELSCQIAAAEKSLSPSVPLLSAPYRAELVPRQ